MTGASGLGTWAKGSAAPVLASKFTSHYREVPVQRDLGRKSSLAEKLLLLNLTLSEFCLKKE